MGIFMFTASGKIHPISEAFTELQELLSAIHLMQNSLDNGLDN
jgi:hypothetical protein